MHRFGDGRRGEGYAKGYGLEIIEGLAIGGDFQAAGDQAGFLQFFEMKMQKRPADADIPGQLADIGAPLFMQGRDDPQPVRIGEGGQGREQVVA